MTAQALSLAHVTVDVQRRDVTGRRTGWLRVLDDCSLRVRPGEALVLMGPAASGKSTLLDLFAGFAQPAAGRVEVGNTEVTGPAPDRGFVAQSYGLFPWRSALDNVTFALDRDLTDEERDQRGLRALKLVGLADAAARPAASLGAAEKQRLALARAVVHEPGVLLLDDPFAQLDETDRRILQDDLLRIQREAGVTLVFATTDLGEAVRIGTRVAVLTAGPGRVETVVTVDPMRHLESASRIWAALNPVEVAAQFDRARAA